MKGLELEHKDIVKASVEDGVVNIIISMSNENINVIMNGIENNNFVQWYESTLKVGENIKIKVKDINQNSEFRAIKSRNDLLKKEFDLLEKELKEKGLI
jgi:hypothetical protein